MLLDTLFAISVRVVWFAMGFIIGVLIRQSFWGVVGVYLKKRFGL